MSQKVTVVSRPISIDGVVRTVRDKRAGAVVTFIGTVRDNSDGMRVQSVDVEAAKELALADLKRIGNLATREFDITSLAVSHRVGRLKPGEIIVVIAVSAPHRKDAFRACGFVIDELKKTTPIWKKEFGKGAERWVTQEA